MTQLSPNLLTYEQLLVKVNKLLLILNQRSGITKEEIAEQYSSLITDVKNSLGSTLTKYDPFINGEPPVSSKMNNFFRSCKDDISIIARQLDLMNAKTVDVFNLFNREIENEKKFAERIASKAKILQMYSRSPSDDLVYVGDSFENDDLIDYTKITKGLNPLIKNGIASLPVSSAQKMLVSAISILDSNGFIGNSHQVIRSVNDDQSSEYKFVFENSETLNNLNSVRDANPLTYFEYEAINVDKTTASPIPSIPPRDNEFKYIKSSTSNSSTNESTLVDWSSHNIDQPLEMNLQLSTRTPRKINSIDITPYFGSCKFIEVSEINIYDKSGSSENVIDNPIFIGSSIIPINLQMAKYYYYNKATIRFREREVLKAEIKFKQSESSDIQIQHIYWKPTEANANNPFVDAERFNPDALSRDIYESIEYNRYSLLPTSANPVEFKKSGDIFKTVNVSIKKKPTARNFFVIQFSITPEEGPVENIYFQQWFSESGRDENNDPIVIKTALFTKNIIVSDDEIQTINYPTEENAQEDYDSLVATYLNETPYVINPIEGVTSGGTVTAVQVISQTITPVERVKTYRVPVKTEKELYSAKRWAIGLRDVELYSEVFQDELEIVSLPFLFDLPVEAVMLSLESSLDEQLLKDCTVQSQISVDGGSSWIDISPIQLDFNSTPEVIYFNQSTVNEFQLSGAFYANDPRIPKEVKNIIVKIKVRKASSKNFTPNIYSYQLIAKVKRS